MQSNFYIYLYLDQNNVPFYVGKGKDYRYLISNHVQKFSPNKFLKNKILKVGKENVIIKFLYEDLTEEEAFEREEYWISYYGRRDLGRGPLCNLSDGGDGSSPSEETKRKIGKGNKGKVRSKELKKELSIKHLGQVAWNKGKVGVYSDETKQKMRKAKEGRIFSAIHKMNIGKALIGHIHSDETIDKMIKAHKAPTPQNEAINSGLYCTSKGRKIGMLAEKRNCRVLTLLIKEDINKLVECGCTRHKIIMIIKNKYPHVKPQSIRAYHVSHLRRKELNI